VDTVSDHIAKRCGFVALIGAPNAGKSTLVNRLVGAKVSIVSRKVQTTRSLIRGIVLRDDSQIVLVDTPGIFEPRRRLDRAMVATAWGGARDADVVALLIDAIKGVDKEVEALLAGLGAIKTPKVVLINKIDAVPREALLGLAEKLHASAPFDQVFMISALPLRRLAAEITREKLFERLHQVLPYQATVETESWREQQDGSVRVDQTIYVTRDSHKKIVIGKGGQAIKAISMAARQEIAGIAERAVHLFVFVKVREKWIDDPERYREMGIEFPQD